MPTDFSNEFGSANQWTSIMETHTKKGAGSPDGPIDTVQSFPVKTRKTGFRNKYPHTSSKVVKGWRSPNPYNRHIERFTIFEDGYHSHKYPGNHHFPVLRGVEAYRVDHAVPEWDVLDVLSREDLYGARWEPSRANSNAVNQAEVKALNKFIDGGAEVGSGLAQAKKTVNEAATVVHEIHDIYVGFRTRNIALIMRAIAGDRGAAKRLAELWLRYQYGWKPLLSDLKSLWDQYHDGLLSNGTRLHTVGKAHESWSRTTSRGDNIQCELFVNCTLYAHITDMWAHAQAKNGLRNPLSIAWELLPWSFVVDWIMPVGQWLSAQTATAGLAFDSGTLSTTVKASGEVIDHNLWRFSPFEAEFAGGRVGYTLDALHFRRSVYGSFPAPVPFLKNPVSSAHALNAAALIVNMKR